MNVRDGRRWPVAAEDAPQLSERKWYVSSTIGVVFLLLGFTQLIGFQTFSDNLALLGFGNSRAWAGLLIFAEFWAAAGFFRIRLSPAFRKVSNFLALFASGFWFYEATRQVSAGVYQLQGVSANFFGRSLYQTPGWWTVIEATVFIFLVLYILDSFTGKRRRPVTVTQIRRGKEKKNV